MPGIVALEVVINVIKKPTARDTNPAFFAATIPAGRTASISPISGLRTE
jgi:hypothetical protein